MTFTRIAVALLVAAACLRPPATLAQAAQSDPARSPRDIDYHMRAGPSTLSTWVRITP